MRRPRDFESELKALDDKVRLLRERRLRHLGELVIACGADALPVELLAGALLDAAATNDSARREGWRAAGAGFFQAKRRSAAGRAGSDGGGAAAARREPGAAAARPST